MGTVLRSVYEIFREGSEICTDTRKIKPGDIYIALKGERFNGNRFAHRAIEMGARIAVVDEAPEENPEQILKVNDGLLFLQQLATHHRRQLDIPLIGLTGSNGKTTTKELLLACLSQKYNCFATRGNLNNHIGVPLSLLALKSDHQIAVIEMGANHRGEIARLCEISLPDYGLITNFGKAHLEGFGGFEGVIAGKSELYDHLRANSKTAFVHSTDTVQMEKSTGITRITFGADENADFPVFPAHKGELAGVNINGTCILTALGGHFNFGNIAAACAIAQHFEVKENAIKSALESYQPSDHRSEIVHTDQNELLVDCYNANPSSMSAAISSFLERESPGEKMMILGDMFELGKDAANEHQTVADMLGELPKNTVLLAGENFSAVESHHLKFPSTEAVEAYLREQKPAQKFILLKGSRGMKLEELIPVL